MPVSTTCTTYVTVDTRRPTPSQCTPDSPSSEDESGYEGDDHSDDEAAGVELITQDQAMWTIEELEVLSTFKDEWMESGFDQQGNIVENAVKELLALRKQDPGPLRKKVRTWLRRKVKKRKAFGPGKAPTLHNVVAWYNDAELNKRVKEKHGVIPGDKARFIGLWKKELTAMVNDLKNNPANKKELRKIENQRTKWTEKGPPPDKRKWAAEKKAMDMVRNFAYDIYWETGARVVVTIGYRNTKNTVCVGQFDWNEYLGTNGTSFVDTHDAEAKPFVDKFKKYADENLTGDEAEDMHDVSAPKAQLKLSKLKPDIIFQRNSNREPVLPVDCLALKLDDKKHVFRCFLKSQYALAKDVKYPGSGCTPPWAKLSESPDRFFPSEDVPEVDYEDGRRKVTLQDPSRMKNHELNACLHLWQERQKDTKNSFTFHHWWSEGQKGYIQRQEPRHLDSDDEDDADMGETLTGTVTGKQAKTEKGKKPKKKRKHSKKNPTDSLSMPPKREEETVQDTSFIDNPPPLLPPKDLPPVPGSTVNDLFSSTSAPENFQSHYPGPASPSIMTLQTATIPIDPALTGFPTEGPNDHVPQGFHAIPHSMLSLHSTAHNIPVPPNPGVATIPAGLLPTIASPGTMSMPQDSTDLFTLERLGQMLLSLEARLSLQEQHQNTAKPEPQLHPTPPVVERLTMEDEMIDTRPRTWPTRATPPKTRRQATQTARDSKVFGERHDTGRTKVGTKLMDLEVQEKPKTTRGTKRKVEEVQKSDGSSTKPKKKVKFEENEEKVKDPRNSVRPRPVTRRGVREVVDEDDHFRLRSRSKR